LRTGAAASTGARLPAPVLPFTPAAVPGRVSGNWPPGHPSGGHVSELVDAFAFGAFGAFAGAGGFAASGGSLGASLRCGG